MWIVKKSYPQIHDFKPYLLALFTDLEFDSDHELVYVNGGILVWKTVS